MRRNFVFLVPFLFIMCQSMHDSREKLIEPDANEMQLVWLPDIEGMEASCKKQNKLIVSINLSCESCLEEFKLWETIIPDIDADSTCVRFVVHGYNDAFRNHMFSNPGIGKFCYYDTDNSFLLQFFSVLQKSS